MSYQPTTGDFKNVQVPPKESYSYEYSNSPPNNPFKSEKKNVKKKEIFPSGKYYMCAVQVPFIVSLNQGSNSNNFLTFVCVREQLKCRRKKMKHAG